MRNQNKTAAIVFIVSCVATTLGLANIAEARDKTHDGFFLRLAGGLSFSDTEEQTPLLKLNFAGSGFARSLAAGFMVAPNLAINADVFGLTLTNPTVSINGEELGEADGELSVDVFGVGITYYLMPQNIYFAGSIGAARMTAKADGRSRETDTGWGINALIGKEWWVSAEWGIGLAGQLLITSVPDRAEGTAASDNDNTLDTLSIGLLFTATYN